MTLLALIVAVAVAGAVQSISGFGFALVAAPVLVAVTDPVQAVTTVTVLGVLVNVVTLVRARGRATVLRDEALGLTAWAVPGLAIGALLLTRLPDDAVRVAVGVLVLAALAQRRWAGDGPPAPRRWSRPAAGLASGAMTTTTGLNGPPLVLHLTSRRAPATAVRDTLAALFVVLGLAGGAALAVAGALDAPDGGAALLPAAVAGGLAGHRLHDRMSEAARARAVTALLVGSALVAIVAALR